MTKHAPATQRPKNMQPSDRSLYLVKLAAIATINPAAQRELEEKF